MRQCVCSTRIRCVTFDDNKITYIKALYITFGRYIITEVLGYIGYMISILYRPELSHTETVNYMGL